MLTDDNYHRLTFSVAGDGPTLVAASICADCGEWFSTPLVDRSWGAVEEAYQSLRRRYDDLPCLRWVGSGAFSREYPRREST